MWENIKYGGVDGLEFKGDQRTQEGSRMIGGTDQKMELKRWNWRTHDNEKCSRNWEELKLWEMSRIAQWSNQ